ncbi:flagellar basal body-associated protein FliL [Sphingomonas canadensis]|uniref:Flagellar protein FliL n=1 Tax=Sphingomonas canadensis TaxID=1219257 RepID=A0ABW3H296_9SPHN|nr:flagellar basal body-associated FliL family protein [Sphingomonas canadensis]MCW3834821.1 flagellar basal body-associated FliL family protein [Sphingomonas canadensis]
MEDITGDSGPGKKKKKGGLMKKLLLFVVLPLVAVGGGVGGALYAMNAGWFSAKPAGGDHADADKPKLVPKSEEKRASVKGGEGGGHGEGGDSAERHGKPTPEGEGGDEYASAYYPLEKEFTSNLQDSVHFVQVGIAVETHYDDRVLENIKTHEIAIRSAILLALSQTGEDEVFNPDGKKAMQERLVKAINEVLKEKEGFGGVSNVYFTNFIVQ